MAPCSIGISQLRPVRLSVTVSVSFAMVASLPRDPTPRPASSALQLAVRRRPVTRGHAAARLARAARRPPRLARCARRAARGAGGGTRVAAPGARLPRQSRARHGRAPARAGDCRAPVVPALARVAAGARVRPRHLRTDLEHLHRLYRSRGYYHARVAHDLELA